MSCVSLNKVNILAIQMCLIHTILFSQSSFTNNPLIQIKGGEFVQLVEIKWLDHAEYLDASGEVSKQVFFEGAEVLPDSYLPIYSHNQLIRGNFSDVSYSLESVNYREANQEERIRLASVDLSSDFQLNSQIGVSRGQKNLYLSLLPLRKVNGKIQLLTSAEIRGELEESNDSYFNRDANTWAENSRLSNGEWVKISTGQDGIYKMDYSFFESCGFTMNNISSDMIRLFGTPAGALSVENSVEKPDDIIEMSLKVEDGGDGMFDKGDYVLFFGEDQDTWRESGARFLHDKNPYADSNAYFITISGGSSQPKRVAEIVTTNTNRTSTSYDYYDFHEVNSSNLIKSGRAWYGEQLGIVPFYDFGFSVPDVVQSENAFLTASFAARSVSVSGTKMMVSIPNQGVATQVVDIQNVSSSYAQLFADRGQVEFEFLPKSSNFLTKVQYDNSVNSQAQGWIDELELNARRTIRFLPPYMQFRDRKTVGEQNTTRFNIQHNSDDFEIWDVTNLSDIQEMELNGNVTNGFWFSQSTDSLREFIAFTSSSYKLPVSRGKIENQNLHSLRNVEYVILTHPLFRTYAEQIAEFHRDQEGMSVELIEIQKVYNEFSGGVQDITAIKELMRMLYKRALSENGTLPHYLLLFGDASYDYLNRVSGNSNFIPSYQTASSLYPTTSIVSDDYFGLLDDSEGEALNDLVDIGIGRLPARTRAEADAMTRKTLAYASSKSFGEWRNWMAFVTDDSEAYGDPHVFMKDADELDQIVRDSASRMNVQKLFMDSYTQVSGSGGQRYPTGSEAISERVGKGALMMYYIGHGGELGWAHERILEVSTINKWANSPKLPVFITATCEFTRFDDPRRTSAGEYVMLNPDGGGVALLTTTRAVYGSPNLTLTTQFTKAAFSSINNGEQRLGELTRLTKVRSLTLGDTVSATALIANNTRCFALLGDPALKLAYPQYDIFITSMPDTIKALDKVKIKGRVADKNGNTLEDFNGIVVPVIFDKVSDLRTQDNDGEGAYDYEEQRNIIFRGKVRAIGGLFEVEFIVPKDINKDFGKGKISTYAYDQTRDASGAFFDFSIGGLSDNPILDDDGPQISLFMNNTKFVFGGLTDENPDLYAELYDFSGINMVGSGIGHDLIAVLDEKSNNTIVLNDYYEAEIDSYQKGKVIYPFNDLEEGLHKLKFQAWDVHNNPSDAYTEFVVANSEEFALDHILNYPNPFTTNTSFFFEHNKPGLSLDVNIDIFTISGKIVKSLRGDYYSNGFRVGPIQWNGLDEYGDNIGKGVYLYKLKVKTPQGQTAEEYERLVILN